jgi:hypothetical protein
MKGTDLTASSAREEKEGRKDVCNGVMMTQSVCGGMGSFDLPVLIVNHVTESRGVHNSERDLDTIFVQL